MKLEQEMENVLSKVGKIKKELIGYFVEEVGLDEILADTAEARKGRQLLTDAFDLLEDLEEVSKEYAKKMDKLDSIEEKLKELTELESDNKSLLKEINNRMRNSEMKKERAQ